MMDTMNRESVIKQGEGVRELIRWLAAFEDNPGYRERIQAWLRSRAREGQTSPFELNATATTVFDTLCNVTERGTDGEYVIRAADIRRYISWLTRGQPERTDAEPIAIIQRTILEISAVVWISEIRFCIPGSGVHQMVQFASPYTGLTFVARASLNASREAGSSVYARAGEDPSRALEELFDTLAIDSQDTIYERIPAPPPRWVIIRQDDNGHRIHVAEFNGLAKARARLVELDTSTHKQMYWLEALS